MPNSFQVMRKVRDSFIMQLRENLTNDPKYPYIELASGEVDYDHTKVVVSDIIPQTNAFIPAIVVNTVAGPETRYLGPDDLREIKNNSFVVTNDFVFSSMDLTVNINIYTIDDTIAVDELMDRIYDRFKLITDNLAIGASHVPVQIKAVPASGTILGLNTVADISVGDTIVQGSTSAVVSSIIDATHIGIPHTVGFTLGAATYFSADMAGVEIKRTTFNPSARVFLLDRWYITASLSIECYTEWVADLGVPSTVSAVPITITLNP